VFALLLVARQAREAFFVVLAIGGSLLLNGVMKPFFERPRPQLPWAQVLPDYSFPSGHAMNSLALFLALAIVAWHLWGRRIGVPAAIAATALVLLIGVSRIYLGYHYVTDVVAGFAASLVWLTVVAGAIGAGERARGRWWRASGPMSTSG
ncbi:MAG: phosphatase PAP2 family protein, partial [Candidatus Limnocylindria bacterium]